MQRRAKAAMRKAMSMTSIMRGGEREGLMRMGGGRKKKKRGRMNFWPKHSDGNNCTCSRRLHNHAHRTGATPLHFTATATLTCDTVTSPDFPQSHPRIIYRLTIASTIFEVDTFHEIIETNVSKAHPNFKFASLTA